MKKIVYFIFILLLYNQISQSMFHPKHLKKKSKMRNLHELILTEKGVPSTPHVSPARSLTLFLEKKASNDNNLIQISSCGFEWLVDHFDFNNPASVIKDNRNIKTSYEHNLYNTEDLKEREPEKEFLKKYKKNKIFDLLSEKSEDAQMLSKHIYECLLAELISAKILELPASADDLHEIAEHARKHDVNHLADLCKELPSSYSDSESLGKIEYILREAYIKYLQRTIEEINAPEHCEAITEEDNE